MNQENKQQTANINITFPIKTKQNYLCAKIQIKEIRKTSYGIHNFLIITFFHKEPLEYLTMYKLLTILGLLSIITPKVNSAVYITEIFPITDILGYQDKNAGEFIELFNSADTTVTLKDWILQCGNNTLKFSEIDTIEPQKTFVLYYTPHCIGNGCFDFSDHFSLEAGTKLKEMPFLISSDCFVKLKNHLNQEKDFVDWSEWTEMIKDSGYKHPSLHRDSVNLGCKDSTLSANLRIGSATPGRIDYLFERDEANLWVEIDKDSSNILRMHFTTLSIDATEEEEIGSSSSGTEEEENIQKSIYELINIHPNPVVTQLQITSVSNQTANCRYTLQDGSGLILQQGKLDEEGDCSINMGNLQKGNYVLSIEKDGCSYPFIISKE